MSYARIKGKVAFECDGDRCHEGIETDYGQFGQALAQAKEEGWWSISVNGEWKHFCSRECIKGE